MADLQVKEGTVEFKHSSLPKQCHTWYKIVGDLETSKSSSQSNSGPLPLVTLHGGPGACHNYLLSLTHLTKTYSIPIIFYDQLGNGNSTHIREKRLDYDFWTPDLLIAELENLLSHLGLEKYDLLGQSWGGMMASIFATRQPKGLRRLVISNSPASMPLWVESCNSWRRELPREIDDTITKHENDQTYEDKEYQKAVMVFYKKHLCQVDENGKRHKKEPGIDDLVSFPKDVMDSLNWLEKDDTVYRTMNGPSEFTVVGNLKQWSIIGELGKIGNRTLILNGEFDEGRAGAVYPFFRGIERSKWLTLSGTSHMSSVEDVEGYCQVVWDFLNDD